MCNGPPLVLKRERLVYSDNYLLSKSEIVLTKKGSCIYR